MSFEIKNISKSFGDIQAVSELSFSVNEGEVFGILGPDGAGKTTLFRILVSLLHADEGNAYICGYDVREDYKEIRKIIGYMAGRFSLYQDLTVRENLEFYATVFGTTVEKNYKLVEDIYSHIEPFESRRAGNLSGGMKQKLALSCALIHRPRVLVLDEPTTGVDAVSRKEFWEMLRKIADGGITVLVSTPYMDEAELCDRVGLMQEGKLLTVSDPNDLRLPEGVKLYHFSCTGRIYDVLERFRDIGDEVSAWLFGDCIHVSAENHIMEKVCQEVETWKIDGKVWREDQPGVEDYFMRLMTMTQEKN